MFFFFKERQYNLTTRLHIRGLCFESCLGFDVAGIPAEGNFNKRAFFSGEQIPLLAQGRAVRPNCLGDGVESQGPR